jgi:hypothetical protein
MGKEYNITKTTAVCTACGRQLQADEEFTATLKEAGEEFQREDFCPACWESRGEKDTDVAVWRTHVPRAQEKKKVFVDDELLINFFERLGASEEPVKVNFRFVLALVLMRKRLLAYDRMERGEGGREVWTMHFRGTATPVQVVNPQMDEEKIAEVSRHLGEILPNSESEAGPESAS